MLGVKHFSVGSCDGASSSSSLLFCCSHCHCICGFCAVFLFYCAVISVITRFAIMLLGERVLTALG